MSTFQGRGAKSPFFPMRPVFELELGCRIGGCNRKIPSPGASCSHQSRLDTHVFFIYKGLTHMLRAWLPCVMSLASFLSEACSNYEDCTGSSGSLHAYLEGGSIPFVRFGFPFSCCARIPHARTSAAHEASQVLARRSLPSSSELQVEVTKLQITFCFGHTDTLTSKRAT